MFPCEGSRARSAAYPLSPASAPPGEIHLRFRDSDDDAYRSIGFPDPALTFTVAGSPARSSAFVAKGNRPLLRFDLSSVSHSVSGNRLPTRAAFLGVSFPLRDINRWCLLAGVPDPRLPSLPFRTTSTVYSTSGLAGLFHPAATYWVRSSGCFCRAAVRTHRPPLPSCRFDAFRTLLRATACGVDTAIKRRRSYPS